MKLAAGVGAETDFRNRFSVIYISSIFVIYAYLKYLRDSRREAPRSVKNDGPSPIRQERRPFPDPSRATAIPRSVKSDGPSPIRQERRPFPDPSRATALPRSVKSDGEGPISGKGKFKAEGGEIDERGMGGRGRDRRKRDGQKGESFSKPLFETAFQ
jgi:hypothetical protein